MSNFLGLIMSITAAALLAWSSLRSWQAKNNFLKWGAAGLAALLSIAVSLAGVIMIAGLFKLHARSAPAPDLKVAGTSEQVQRGQAISDGFCSAAIQEPARSPAASTSVKIFRCRSGRSYPPTSLPPGN
jgi:uncharacterized membrane protein YcjF (UPF0283 family)